MSDVSCVESMRDDDGNCGTLGPVLREVAHIQKKKNPSLGKKNPFQKIFLTANKLARSFLSFHFFLL